MWARVVVADSPAGPSLVLVPQAAAAGRGEQGAEVLHALPEGQHRAPGGGELPPGSTRANCGPLGPETGLPRWGSRQVGDGPVGGMAGHGVYLPAGADW